MVTLIFACQPSSEERFINLVKEKYTPDNQSLELDQLKLIRILSKEDLLTQIQEQSLAWRQAYQSQFEADFEAARSFFDQAHVRHLHDQKLQIHETSDSIALIHEHLNSFVNERQIGGQYLNECAMLLATAKEVTSVEQSILWQEYEISYTVENDPTNHSVYVYYFPTDERLLELDTGQTDLINYGLYQFHKHTEN